MSSPTLELARAIHGAWGRGDYSETWWADAEIEFVIVGGPAAGSWRGIAAMSEGRRAWLAAWEGYRAKAVEYRELDDGRVLVLGRMRPRRGAGRAGTETDFANVLLIRDGKVLRLSLHADRDRALADLGLTGHSGG